MGYLHMSYKCKRESQTEASNEYKGPCLWAKMASNVSGLSQLAVGSQYMIVMQVAY